MKKLLALVLALVMTLSLCTISNAAFTDAKDVDASYEEAVAVLNGMGVFKGYEDGSFKPEGSITRAEVAAIVYRLYTGDVKDKQAGLYAGYGKFDDMAGAAWAAGYVGFCANAGFVKGYGDGKFGPSDPVTGYQALAMILRAVGYGKNGEFEGADWELHVAQIAQQLKVLKNVKGVSLKAAASRELVAELLFQVAAYVDTVEYTPAFGYVANTVVNANAETLGEKNFNLTKSADGADNWGRPQYKWFSDDNGNKKVDTKETKYATIQAKPVATYTAKVTECQVAADAKFTGTKTYNAFVNTVPTTDTLNALDTYNTIGAQGRLTEVYSDRIVMIDTFLAKVVSVAAATYDAAGHMITPSKIVLNVYDADTDPASADTTDYILTNGATNYTYAEGDMVLVNAATTNGATTPTALTVATDYANNGTYGVILGKANAVTGTQTLIWYNIGKHTVNGTTYPDAAEFHLNEAKESTANHVWYLDQYNNIIGNTEVATAYGYAVVKNMWWAPDATNGSGKAMATLKYMDGSENVVTLASIDQDSPLNTTAYGFTYSTTTGDVMNVVNNKVCVALNAATNAAADPLDIILGHLYKVANMADGSVALSKVWTNENPGAHTEDASATIVNKYAWIDSIKIDVETKFLVRTDVNGVATFTTYTGLNEIPSFQAGAKVDYVLGAGNVADYVYVIGTPVTATTRDFVLRESSAYSAVLKTAGGISYYELTLDVPAEDGNTVMLKVPTTKTTELTALTSVSTVGKLFYVTFSGEYVDAVYEISNTVYAPAGLAPNGRAVLVTNATMAGGVITATINGGTSTRFNVTSATAVVGELSSNMVGKSVYMIFDATNLNVSKVYVLTPALVVAPTTVPTLVSATVTAAGATYGQAFATETTTFTSLKNNEGYELTTANPTAVAATKATLTWYKMNTSTGVYELWTGNAVAGSYICTATLSTTATSSAGIPYAVSSTAAVTTNYTVASPLVIANP